MIYDHDLIMKLTDDNVTSILIISNAIQFIKNILYFEAYLPADEKDYLEKLSELEKDLEIAVENSEFLNDIHDKYHRTLELGLLQ